MNGRGMLLLLVCAFHPSAYGEPSFVNWENPHVHPIDLTPDHTKVLAVNTADARLEVFHICDASLVAVGSVFVGLDPVSVRARSNGEAWVVNHISDSISIVDLVTLRVIATLGTQDEPADVVFAGSPTRAFVSCSQANSIQVFDPQNLSAPPATIEIDAEDPRAFAVSPDGKTIYAAIFESGNGTTVLGGGRVLSPPTHPPNVINLADGPYGGQNPPPNCGSEFCPPQNPANPPPPGVSLIVRKNHDARWLDDNHGDWTELVSGELAGRSGRPVGWDMPDRDLAMIDTETLTVTYATRLMNLCMAVGVNPVTGQIAVVGTDSTNEIRYEPNLRGRFLRVNLAFIDSNVPHSTHVIDLNPHLHYDSSAHSELEREQSIGDPRGIVWTADGTRAYVIGMGSNNVVQIDGSGSRTGSTSVIQVGEGPTGLAIDDVHYRIYVLNRFEASISIVDTLNEVELSRMPLFDPTPLVIKTGRKHLYDTHKNSNTGHASCASCHVDGRIDRLAWDLGNPAGEVKTFNQNCNAEVFASVDDPIPCEDWHPMKGPTLTQTFQDIIGKEPFHWRGDREGIEIFSSTFFELLGSDTTLTPQEMQEFEDFLATITFPPNPFRNFDNSLPTDLPMPGHYTTGRFAPAGLPLPPGDAVTGLNEFRFGLDDQGIFSCGSCHSLPTGVGTYMHAVEDHFEPYPPGPYGEEHHAINPVNRSTNVSTKIPQLRNLYDRVGFEMTQVSSRSGFGFLHDGSVDSIARFVSEPVFDVRSDQEYANMVAFMLTFSGSDLPLGSEDDVRALIGPASKDTHAAVGSQITFSGADGALEVRLQNMLTLADSGAVAVVAKGRRNALDRGYAYGGGGLFQSDRATETMTAGDLLASASTGSELTFTVVPLGTQRRLGIDRDEDGHLDADEYEACSNPADVVSTPGTVQIDGDSDGDGLRTLDDLAPLVNCIYGPGGVPTRNCRCWFDETVDGKVDLADASGFQQKFNGLSDGR